MADGANQPDEFTNAFAAALADTPAGEAPAAGGSPVETPPTEAPPAGETPPAEAPPAEETPPAETPPAGETPPAEAPPAGETPPSQTSIADDIVKGLSEVLKNQPVPAAAAPETVVPEAEQPPLYSSEEMQVLTDYDKNWPDVSRAESLRRRAEYHDLMKFVFSEVHKYVNPMFEQVRTIGNTLHVGELKQAVPDYSDSLEADVSKWIETQPAYLQAPYKQVMQIGTSEEVADLIGRYRGSIGTAPTLAQAAPAAAGSAPAPQIPTKTELSSAAKQAAESLAPVSAERSSVPEGENSQDYQTNFAKYAAEAAAILT